ncbi:helix-turn-helix domain-containing protein [uncultured Kordia sp.]|uniref:helix-turn-helix domain-containing protein n=1 Tax=uncultured Kordia sp. TaxID=507699 RepID=UPI002624F03E|nr:helix-turn-helix domain-containing protein [uncultured Kordia sp.]
MLRFFLCACFLIKTLQIKAQDHTIPDYQNLKTYTYDSLQNAFKSSVHTEPKLGKVYANAYYKKALTQNDIKETYLGAHQYALVYKTLGQKDSALYFINIALKQAEIAKDHQQYASSLFLKGNIYYSATNYIKAIANYTSAYDIIKKDNDSIKLAVITNSIALIKNQIGETKQALDLIKNNLLFYDKLREKNDPRFREGNYINTLLNLSNTYTNLAEDYQQHKVAYLDSATTYCLKGITNSLNSNDNEAHCIFLTLQGIINQKKGNLKKSIAELTNVEQKVKELNIIKELPYVYFYQGKNYFLQHDIDNALPYFLKVDSIVQKDKINSMFLQENYILLIKCFEQKSDTDKLLHYLKIFKNIATQNDEIIRKSSQSIYNKYDVPSFTAKIELLTQDATLEKERTLFLKKISFFLIGIIILGILYYLRLKQKYKRRFETILKELNSTTKKITGKTVKEIVLPKSKEYKISDENIQKILDGLALFENEKMFLQQKCSINFLAKEINTNATYLSKTLQSHKGKKFVQYITDLRINYALVQLKENKKFRAYDIKSIASELGFNTAESFSKSFKKQTGIYPSFYIKKLNLLDD